MHVDDRQLAGNAAAIDAKVYRVIAEPYSEQELARMDSTKARMIRFDGLEKIVQEQQIADVHTPDRDELKSRVVELCLQYVPYPVIVKLGGSNNNTLNRTFIVDRRYSGRDPEALWENIIFGYSQRGKEILKFVYDKVFDIQIKRETGDPLGGPQYAQIGLESLYAELDRRFGIKLSRSPVDTGAREVYRTTEEARTLDASAQQPDLNTVLYDHIQEVARVITKGSQRKVDYVDYLARTLGERVELSVADAVMNTEIPPDGARWEFGQGTYPPPSGRRL